MKKIITLALAAVMTLGLTVLPQAGIEEDYTAAETTVKGAEKTLKEKKEALEIAQEKYNTKEKEGY